MDFAKVEEFYRGIYSRHQEDDGDETTLPSRVHEFIASLNPPPDTLYKLRATAFKVACQFLPDTSLSPPPIGWLLRQIHGIVTTIHNDCYNRSMSASSNETSFDDPTNEEEVRNFLTSLLDEMKLDTEENDRLLSFLRSQPPASAGPLIPLIFNVGQAHLQDNGNGTNNEQVLRCMNVMVHAVETVFYQPKPYHLHLSTSAPSSSYSAMAATAAAASDPDDTPTASTATSTSTLTNSNVDLKSMTLNDAAQQLWNYDANRLVMNDDLQLNVQNGKKPYHKEDAATDPLFTHVDPQVLQRSTYAAFSRLLDNYHSETGRAEQTTALERDEVEQFLSIIMETAPMQFCYQYCRAHDVIDNHGNSGGSINDFKELLYTIWFEPYSRDGNERDSSGFEHVFIGEIQDNAISGFHNWIQFYHQEQKGNIDYRGYIKPRGKQASSHCSDGSDDHLLTLQFAWKNHDQNTYVEKFVGTMFIGVSPEFEMALYTMCFLFGQEENILTLDTGVDIFEIVIKCYTMARGKIGTTFPEVNSHYDDNDD